MIQRGGQFHEWLLRPEGDTVWTADDWARAQTLDARLKAKQVSEDERSRLIPCALWKRKFPGLLYGSAVESRLQQLLPQN